MKEHHISCRYFDLETLEGTIEYRMVLYRYTLEEIRIFYMQLRRLWENFLFLAVQSDATMMF